MSVGLVVASVVVLVMAWPDWELVPGWGLDDSWRLGLAWAPILGMAWGTDIVFTYGPLSYLLFPSALDPGQIILASLAFAGTTLLGLGFAFLLARRALGLAVSSALIVSTVTTTIALWVPTEVDGRSTLIPVVFGSLYVLRFRSLRATIIVAILLGLLGHLKLSEAMVAGLFSACCVLGGRGVRGLVVLILAGGLAWAGLWFISGQGTADLRAWLEGSYHIVAGYGTAMRLEGIGLQWHYLAAALLIGLLADQTWWAGKALDSPRRVALASAVAVATWLAWKAGFTRHDGHALIFFTVLLIIASGLLLAGGRGRAARVGALTVIAAILVTGLTWWDITGQPLPRLGRTVDISRIARVAGVIVEDGDRRSLLAQARGDLVTAYALTPSLVQALGNERTAADPWDISALWAAGTPAWDPVPVFQVYSAYAPGLDAANAESLEQDPRQVLRARPYPSIHGRNPVWDAPRYQAALYCDYAVMLETPRWQILRPTGWSRCGDIVAAETVMARANETVSVPAVPGTITLATIEPQSGFVERALELLLARVPPMIEYAGERYRYAHGSEATRLMLNAPVAHPAFPDLPPEPFATISIDVPATITFELQGILAACGPPPWADPAACSHT